ncbi:4-hydroxythreonine-4-phosphate dehydrogenase PdxA [Pseudoroseomonas globiformis]|uniref:4-hydroxythreonine-4-phosphate dehydrogenase n=1 Tax=Teichococcus globiformis TaxID=2307229 RepID=A0ABV7G982_9PROT
MTDPSPFQRALPPLALTMGEPAGIGGEIAAKAWSALRQNGPPFFLIGDPGLLPGIPWQAVEGPEDVPLVFPRALPIMPLLLARPARPGFPDAANASATIDAIRQAVALTVEGRAGAVVTNPIQKATLKAAGFPYPGHTEFLADLAPGEGPPVMLLAAAGLRTVPVTIHCSLREAIERLDQALIIRIARAAAAGLRQDFGIPAPRLAVAGLNPHAGEEGTMGTEDRDIVAPAIEVLQADGIDARGPFPADTMFTPHAREGYDVALGLYHDQALIPVKTLDMAGGVNVTLGLSIVRTSPDHGTALNIAGKGIADPGSLIAALRLAAGIAQHRRHHHHATQGPS